VKGGCRFFGFGLVRCSCPGARSALTCVLFNSGSIVYGAGTFIESPCELVAAKMISSVMFCNLMWMCRSWRQHSLSLSLSLSLCVCGCVCARPCVCPSICPRPPLSLADRRVRLHTHTHTHTLAHTHRDHQQSPHTGAYAHAETPTHNV
jgi:hypothetical protein